MELFNLIDKLEGLAGSGSRVPMTKKVMIDLERFLDLIDQLRVAIPQDAKEAQQILQKQDRILSQALLESRRIKTDADVERTTRVAESQVVKEAQQRSEQILAEAQGKSARMLADAQKQAESALQETDQYTIDVLGRLEQELSTQLGVARRGIEALRRERISTKAGEKSNGVPVAV